MFFIKGLAAFLDETNYKNRSFATVSTSNIDQNLVELIRYLQ